MAKAPFNLEDYKKALELVMCMRGRLFNHGTKLNSSNARCKWHMGGYTGEGAKTVIASKAFAKISDAISTRKT